MANKKIVRALLLLATVNIVPCAFGQTSEFQAQSCEFEMKRGCVSGSAYLDIKDGTPQKVKLDIVYCGAPGQPAYTCFVEAVRTNADLKWSSAGGATKIEFSNSENWEDGNSMLVKPVKGGHLLDFHNTKSSGFCGAGAAIPESVTIPDFGKCKVKLE